MNINIHVYGLFTVSRSWVEHNAELGYYNKFSQVARLHCFFGYHISNRVHCTVDQRPFSSA